MSRTALDVCYRCSFAIGNHWAHLRQDPKKGFETVAEVMDGEVEGDDEIHPQITSGGTSVCTRPLRRRARIAI